MTSIPSDIIAHRGGAKHAPENTLAAFTLAASQGCAWVETDVSLLGDGTLVLFHDETVDRCTDGNGALQNHTVEDLSHLDAGSWFAPAFAGEPIPQLAQALEHLQYLGLGLNLELKVHGNEAAALVPKVHQCLQEHWRDPSKLIVSSFDWQSLSLLRSLDTTVKLGLLMEGLTADWQEAAEVISAYSIHADYQQLTLDEAKAVKAAGYKLYLYTINDRAAGEAFRQAGADGLITDDPLLFGMEA